MKIGIILLAAGRSERFGSDKRCAPWPGQECLLKASAKQAQQSGLPCYVVMHPGDHTLTEQCLPKGVMSGICPDAAAGIGHSIAFGVHANQGWDGWIIARADMPWITPETYLLLARHLYGHDCARPVDREGRAGFPTAFRKEHAFALMRLGGNRNEVRLIPDDPSCLILVDDDMIHADVTTPDDLPQAG